MDEVGRLPYPLNNDNERDHDVAHNKNGEIGWRIIGALVVQCFAAMGARIVYLHEFMEQETLATGRAFSSRTPPHGLLP